MIFEPLRLAGAFRLRLERHVDERGSFARVFCRDEMRDHGLPEVFVQANLSTNRRRGTVRGMHWQAAPALEAKIVRCQRGALWDVLVDLRPESATYGQWEAVELDDRGDQVFVPAGFAHGFQTLADHTEVFYLMSTPYAPDHACGFRFDDPEVGIEWPLPVQVISERDRSLPGWREAG